MTNPAPTHDPLSPELHELLAIFEGPLSSVTFPDVDGSVLASLADEVLAEQCAVEDAEAALFRAREALEGRKSALVARAKRALAYAQIFAEGDPDLSADLVRIAASFSSTPQASARPVDAPRKRGRPRKVDATLFGGDESAELDAVAAQ